MLACKGTALPVSANLGNTKSMPSADKSVKTAACELNDVEDRAAEAAHTKLVRRSGFASGGLWVDCFIAMFAAFRPLA